MKICDIVNEKFARQQCGRVVPLVKSSAKNSLKAKRKRRDKVTRLKAKKIKTHTNLNELHRAVYERIYKMSLRDGFRTLVASGIYTANGNLSKRYGG